MSPFPPYANFSVASKDPVQAPAAPGSNCPADYQPTQRLTRRGAGVSLFAERTVAVPRASVVTNFEFGQRRERKERNLAAIQQAFQSHGLRF